MADVTDVDGPPVGVGDEFVLIGRQGADRITVAELAAARSTNSWEVVTDLAARLPRVYHAASVPWGLRTMAGHFGAMQMGPDAEARSDAQARSGTGARSDAGGRRSMRP
jgi:hypothetical protein